MLAILLLHQEMRTSRIGIYKTYSNHFQLDAISKINATNPTTYTQNIRDALTKNLRSSIVDALQILLHVPYAPPATPIDAPRIAKIVPVSVIVLVPSLCIMHQIERTHIPHLKGHLWCSEGLRKSNQMLLG